MKALLPLLLLVGLALPAQAKVTEKTIELPNHLGTALLYQDDSQSAKGPGVIVVHEWWGLNDYAKHRAQMLAEAGYPAVAVDMYGTGQVAEHPDNAKAFMQAALKEPDKLNARFEAAWDILRGLSLVDKDRVYAIGYCFGGAVVLNQARLGKPLAGVASFHGSLGSSIKAEPGTLKARLLVATGGSDPFVPAEQATAFVSEMLAAGADLDFRVYPGAVHSFTVPDADGKGEKFKMPFAYDERADKDSWAALLRMLKGQ
ncbi:dienelactone hydrolase family protein [Gallaecimonas xiamenensis]|uniref:Dienelactone hydrolase family protein n=1 Tax=Gallaecimonas xiamenensis 3-C-1 TaxID=745411 RepID=K2JHH2_9GAMM|nr:dienelactone hydrolase family protein [Gallaecimonas xiamenensis]EKE74007.1 dienelactone hydrolase family protein [Gallaecimonas xiamenensis 3-C-1]